MDCLILKVKTLRSFGMSLSKYMYVLYQSARCNIPEDLNLALSYCLMLGYNPLEQKHTLGSTLLAPSVRCHLLSHVARCC